MEVTDVEEALSPTAVPILEGWFCGSEEATAVVREWSFDRRDEKLKLGITVRDASGNTGGEIEGKKWRAETACVSISASFARFVGIGAFNSAS